LSLRRFHASPSLGKNGKGEKKQYGVRRIDDCAIKEKRGGGKKMKRKKWAKPVVKRMARNYTQKRREILSAKNVGEKGNSQNKKKWDWGGGKNSVLRRRVKNC